MSKRNTAGWSGGGRRPRLATKAVTALAAFALAASMCPGVAALAFANGQLAADSGDLQEKDGAGQLSEQGEIIVDENTHEMTTGTYHVTNDVNIRPAGMGGNGITIAKGANVTLIIDKGKLQL